MLLNLSTGHHTEQQRLQRKKVNMPDFTDYDSEEKVFQEPSLGGNSAGAIERNSILADVTGDCRNSNKMTLEGTSDSNNFCSGVTEDCSRSNLVVPNVSQFNEAPLSHADQIFTSFDSSLGATCVATVNKNLSSDIVPVEKGRLPEKFDKDSVILEEFENHNCLKSMKRRSDTMSDFTEYGSRKKVREKSSFDDNFVGAIERNVAVVDVTGDYSDSNKKTLETNSSSNNLSGGYLTENCQRFNLVITVDSQTSNLSQADEAPSSEVDQAFTSSDSSSEAAHTSAGNEHLSNNVVSDQTNKLTKNLDKRSINLEDFEYFNDFKSLKKRRDCLPEYASGKETFEEEVFLGDNLVVELERNNNLADVTDDYPGSNKMALEVKSTANTLSSGVTEHCQQSNLKIIEDCQKSNLPQSEETPLIQVDQIVTSSDSSSEAITDMVFVANDKLVENLDKETVAYEKFENHDVLKGTKRRFDGLSDFTKYGSGKKMCQESSMGNNLMGAIETNSTLVDATDNYHDSNKITLEANLIPDNINSGVTEDFQRSNLVITNDCQRTSLSQFDEAFLSQIDQAVTSSDSSPEATPAASVNKHPSSDIIQVEKAKCHGNLNTESILLELFDNPRNLKSNKRRRDCMSDFTEHGLWKKFCQEPSLGDKLVGAVGRKSTLVNTVSDPDCKMMMLEVTSSSLNGGMEGLSAFTATMQTNIIDEAASESYLNDGHSIIVDVAGKVMADNPSFYSEVSGQHVIGSMPLLTECSNDENFENAAQETVEATVSEKLDFTMLEESPGCTTFSSAMSVEINPKIPYANFKGDSSLPPSPITGVIDCFIGKSNGHDLHSVSLNEEDTSFSFHPPNKTFGKEISRNEIGLDIQGTLGRFADSHECSQNLSIGIYGDRQSEQKERAAFASCSTSEGDNLISEGKNTEVQIIDSIPLEISLRRHPRKKLIVLDLNGLLCDIVNDYYPSCRVEKKVGGKPIFKRPFCDDFMKFCFDNFHIGIWSSRRKYNVDGALDYLMGEFKQQLLFCWDQSKCTYTGARTIENHHKPLVLKELKKLWNKEEPDLPWEEGEFTPSNTLLLDDSPYKALCNPRYTAIFPRPYKYTDEGDESLGPGGDIRVYLENLLASDDIRDFIKEHPFGQPPITESDRHWDFYHRIIRNNSAIHYNA